MIPFTRRRRAEMDFDIPVDFEETLSTTIRLRPADYERVAATFPTPHPASPSVPTRSTRRGRSMIPVALAVLGAGIAFGLLHDGFQAGRFDHAIDIAAQFIAR